MKKVFALIGLGVAGWLSGCGQGIPYAPSGTGSANFAVSQEGTSSQQGSGSADALNFRVDIRGGWPLLKWSRINNATEYNVKIALRNQSAGNAPLVFHKMATLRSNSTSYFVSMNLNIFSTTNLYFKMNARDATGRLVISNTVCVRPAQSLSEPPRLCFGGVIQGQGSPYLSR